VLFLGRLQRLKGWPELLYALPKAAVGLGRKLMLVVAGDGPDREAFETEARRHGIPAEFLGWIGAQRRDAEMRNADVMVLPSVVPETFGLVGVEAGSVGLPTVAFAVGGIPDWLTAGEAGELAPGERPDASEFAAALVRALADDEHLQKLRVGAWNMARRFTVAGHVERLLEVFQAVAQPNASKPK
jgi:glycosyltransferase involved in cell wall biosynthesis